MTASAPPSLAVIYLRAALGLITKKHSLGPEVIEIPSALIPEETLQFTVDPNHVKFFQKIINSTPSSTTDHTRKNNNNAKDKNIVPAMYLQCLLNSMPMNLLTHRQFPLNIVGSVHESVKLECRKPLYLSSDQENATLLTARCKLLPEIARSDKNDWIFTTITDIDLLAKSSSSATESINNNIMTITNEFRILNPQRHTIIKSTSIKSTSSQPSVDDDFSDETIWEPIAHWEFPVDTGRRYAALNGDINPIHLFPLTAKIFGYKSCIAHGMYSVCKLTQEPRFASALSAESYKSKEVGSGMTVLARFTRPMLLPNKNITVFLKRGTDEFVIGSNRGSENDGQIKAAVKGAISFH